ncbi:MAG: arginine--tRNA ligase [Oligoflexia bacterium]|nr:arginine--tRNA ligase [Oligoflexia bacterium]
MLTKLKTTAARILHLHLGGELAKYEEALEIPKDLSLGDLAFPCFLLAKSQKKAPPAIALELSNQLNSLKGTEIREIRPQGGYVNFIFTNEYWTKTVLSEIELKKGQVGDATLGKGKKVVIDYSSPNVAKPMSIGHLRSTVIGQALVNIHKAVGFETIGINYLGDWGVQFGKLAWAHLNKAELASKAAQHSKVIVQDGFSSSLWSQLIDDLANKPEDSFDYLYALYVVFHAVAEQDLDLAEKGREYFLKLEKRHSAESKNDALTAKIVSTWQKFVEISLVEYDRVYKLLNVKHDLVRGESYHENDLDDVVKRLKDHKLLTLSEGAQIVDLTAYDMPPCLIQKSDGATLYATRDIAAAEDRALKLGADRLIYVVGSEQTLHFKQFFKVLELMGYPWAKDCVHVPFGLYRFKEGKMSTRRGNVIFLEDVLDRAIELVEKIIQEKNPELKNARQVAEQVGTGAVVFHDLMNDRQKSIDFDWDRLLDFNGDTGPYVQYTYARLNSIISKWGKPIPKVSEISKLDEPLEKAVLQSLARMPQMVLVSYEQLKPNWIAQYLLDLCKCINAFYYEHRILGEEDSVQRSRILLVWACQTVIKRGLELLGMPAPQSM